MERRVSDRNILNEFVRDFVEVVDGKGITYIIVSGFVAIAHGRSRGTEDIDMIIEKIDRGKFVEFHQSLERKGFECLQGEDPEKLFEDYLKEETALRYARKDRSIPEMELKLAKDEIDEKEIKERVKLPLTGLPFYFSSIETNLAFKEELLKSEKDLEDARHLRIIYAEKIDEEKVEKAKELIRRYRLSG